MFVSLLLCFLKLYTNIYTFIYFFAEMASVWHILFTRYSPHVPFIHSRRQSSMSVAINFNSFAATNKSLISLYSCFFFSYTSRKFLSYSGTHPLGFPIKFLDIIYGFIFHIPFNHQQNSEVHSRDLLLALIPIYSIEQADNILIYLSIYQFSIQLILLYWDTIDKIIIMTAGFLLCNVFKTLW